MLALLPYALTSNNHAGLCQSASKQWVSLQLFLQVQVLLTHHLFFPFVSSLCIGYLE